MPPLPTASSTLCALIIDDEAPAREELAWLLEQCAEPIRVVGQCDSSRAAIAWLDEHDDKADLLFLDVDMPGVDGVRLAELLARRARPPMVIFVSAYEEYGVDAFDVDAVDYLLKPVRTERLQRALQKAQRRRIERRAGATSSTSEEGHNAAAASVGSGGARYLDRISVEERGVYRVLPIDAILFFESQDGIVIAQTRQERLITDFSLRFLEQNLNPEDFFRSHRSTIVRLDAIASIAPWGAGTYRLVVDRERDLGIPLARSRAAELKSLIPWSASALED